MSKTVLGRGPKAVGSGVLVINDFQAEMNKWKPGDAMESKPFKVKGILFAVAVWPNGYNEAQVGYVSIMVINKSDKEVTVCKYSIQDGEKSMNVEKDSIFKEKAQGTSRGFFKWHTHDACKAVLKDGALVVEAEVTIQGDMIYIDSSYMVQQKCSSFVLEKIYRHKMSDSDFVLECEGELIPCHKIVLCSAAEGLLK